jgi:hypothetical protein
MDQKNEMDVHANTVHEFLEPVDKTTMIPGKNPGTFTLTFTEDWHFKIDDILLGGNGFKVKVTKVYKYNWWKQILNFFGIKFKLFNCILVKEIQ